MLITNTSDNYYYLSNDVHLLPEETSEVRNSAYLGNTGLQNQIDSLYSRGIITIQDEPEGFPLSVVVPEADPFSLPEKYDFREQDLVVSVGDGVAAMSINSDINDVDYGSLELFGSTGTIAGIRSYAEEGDGMIYADKVQDDPQKFFDFKMDGFPAVTLDLASSTLALDVANALIDLGLAEESS